MAVSAPILPPAPNELDLPAEVGGELRVAWTTWWEPLREEVRAHRPPPDTPSERSFLVRFARGLVALVERYGSILRPLLRSGFSRVLEDLLRQEESQATLDRRLALKLLGKAIEALGELYETSIAFGGPAYPADTIAELLRMDDEEFAARVDNASVAFLRLELSVFVAFDLVRVGSVDEFAIWARAAHVAAQRAKPFLSLLPASFQARTPFDLSAEVGLPGLAFDRLVELVESPPAPSAKLRSLMRRGTA